MIHSDLAQLYGGGGLNVKIVLTVGGGIRQ